MRQGLAQIEISSSSSTAHEPEQASASTWHEQWTKEEWDQWYRDRRQKPTWKGWWSASPDVAMSLAPEKIEEERELQPLGQDIELEGYSDGRSSMQKEYFNVWTKEEWDQRWTKEYERGVGPVVPRPSAETNVEGMVVILT
jgi:hypothetical protein